MIGVAVIITTILISARNVIKVGAKYLICLTINNIAKKLSPLLIPLFNMLATVVGWGTKGLASNLWVLILAFAWFVYDQYKKRRK